MKKLYSVKTAFAFVTIAFAFANSSLAQNWKTIGNFSTGPDAAPATNKLGTISNVPLNIYSNNVQRIKLNPTYTLLNTLNSNLSKWISSISDIPSVNLDIEKYVSIIIALFEGQENEELKLFFTDTQIENAFEKVENRIYKFVKGEQEVSIHFDTIHGVKGETHQATLYLETFNRIFDIGGKILDFIISDEKQKAKKRKDGACKKRLPLAYVAMTRATHFICLAVHKDRFTDNHKAYFDESAVWNVIYL